MSVEDKGFIKIAEQSIKLKDGHYTVDLPFRRDDTVLPNNYQVAEQSIKLKDGHYTFVRRDDTVLPNNYQVAEQRLQSLKRKFKRNEQFKTDYTEFLNKVINKGYAEVVPQQELKRTMVNYGV